MLKRMKKAIALLLAIATLSGILMFQGAVQPASAYVQEAVPIYQDLEYSFKERAADLVARMTTAQKFNQMQSNYANAIATSADLPNGGLKAYGWWNECLHGVSRIMTASTAQPATQANATSFPIEFALGQSWDRELIYRVGEIIGQEARELAIDLDRMLTFYSPTVNLARDPRWGRTDEAWGEDPVHVAELASQFVNGLEGKRMDGSRIDPNGYLQAVATIKHYTANNSESNRLNGASYMTEKEAREYYTLVYRLINEKTQVSSVMSSYNRVHIKNSTYSVIDEMPGGINFYTLDTLLRQTFGFSGYVTGDCNSVTMATMGTNSNATGRADQTATSGNGHRWRVPTYTNYGFPTTTGQNTDMTNAQAAAWAIMVGAELECNSGYGGTAYTTASITSPAYVTPYGAHTIEAVDVALANLLEARFELGEFDDKVSYTGSAASPSANRVKWYDDARARLTSFGINMPAANGRVTSVLSGRPNRQAVNAEAAAKSLALLKNNPVDTNGNQPLLPMNIPSTGAFKVVIIGPATPTTTIFLGGYSKSGTNNQVTPVNGIRAAIQAVNPSATVVNYVTTSATLTAAAQADIDTADYVICLVGDTTSSANEASDRANFALDASTSFHANALIPNVYARNHKLITVILSFCTVDITGIDASTPALLYSSFLGDRGGTGIANVIVGNYNPTGRTNAIWYPVSSALTATTGSLNPIRSYKLAPLPDGPWASPNGTSPGTAFTFAGANRGRTYMHYNGTGNHAVRFPFGYGLSYTNFTYSDFVLTGDGVTGSGDNYSVTGDGDVTITFSVKNTGTKKGADVAQLYVKTPESLVNADKTFAIKRLKDFVLTDEIDPGDEKSYSLKASIRDIAFYNEASGKWELELSNGAYGFQVSRSSDEADVQHTFNVTVTSGFTPKPSVITFKPNTPADEANDIPQRLIYKAHDTILPKPTICMTDDVLYGYINKGFKNNPATAMPDRFEITYTSNRANVVSVAEDRKTLRAVGGGVATITGTALDTVTGESVSNEFVIYVDGEPLRDHDVSIKSFKANGETFGGIEVGVYEFDVNVPKGQAAVPAMTAGDVEASYGDDKVTVTVSMPSTTVPCDAVITVQSKEYTSMRQTYTVHFGHMTVSSLTSSITGSGWIGATNVRFSDGVTEFKLIFAIYDGPKLVKVGQFAQDAIPRHGSGSISGAALTENEITEFADGDITLKIFLWDQKYAPIIPAYVRSDPPKLNSISIDGVPIESFSSTVYNYSMSFPSASDQAPEVTVTAPGSLAVSIDQADGIPGVAVITVSKNAQPPVTYTVTFFDRSALVETTIWKLAKTITSGRNYVIVSGRAGGGAMTSTQVSVPVADGVTNGPRNGRAATPVTIKDGYIVAVNGVKLASGTAPASSLQWYVVVNTTAHANAGQATYPFAGQTLYNIRSGSSTGQFLYRDTSSSTRTAPLLLGSSIATAATGLFGIPVPDAETGITSASLYSYNDASNAYMFGLLGNSTGFVGEGTNFLASNTVDPLTAAQVRANAPIMFFEQVTEMLPPDFFG